MGTSLAFHLSFAVFGVGLPVMMLVAEGLHLRGGDQVWLALARRWSKAFAILFAVGAVSGTIISFELGLLWPGFTRIAGGIIGLPFSLEGSAFFLEAMFLGLYLYGWDRLSPRAHWLSGFPIALAGIGSAFFIVTANAWMNVPRGFTLRHGRVVHIDPVAALFNPAWPTETAHMILGALLATAFGVASVYAVGMLRGRRDAYHRRGLAVGLTAAALLAPVQLGAGDLLGRMVVAFGVASAAAPLLFGAAAAGLAGQRLVVAGGHVRAGGGAALWIGPFQLAVGAFAVAACTALAAAFLTIEMGRAGERLLTRRFRAYALRATVLAAGLALVALGLAAADAPLLFTGLMHRGLPAVLAGGLVWAVGLGALARRRDVLARAAVAAGMAAVLWGWGLAQFPRLVGRTVTVARATAGGPKLHAVAIALAAGGGLLVPSLWLLYVAFRRHPTEVSR
jgi:Cytochrome bd terminal oxidase subunit I/Cytochrome bd terminal oxidase subunit II